MSLLATGMCWATTLAQAGNGAADGGEAAGQVGGVPTIAELFMTSPYINGTIAALSVIALAVFLFTLLTVSSSGFAPGSFVDNVTKTILGRNFDQAVTLCQNHPRPFVSSIIQRLVENRDKDHAVLMSIIEAEGRRKAEKIWNRVGYLSEIAAIAPTLGLLGTVIGMIQVFFALTERIAGVGKVAELSAGIAQAMGTTMFGLIVAIIAGVFYTITKSRATRSLAEAEQVLHTVADHIARAGGGGAGGGRRSTRTVGPPTEASISEGVR